MNPVKVKSKSLSSDSELKTDVSTTCFCKPDRRDNTLFINKKNFTISILGCNLKIVTKQNVKKLILITIIKLTQQFAYNCENKQKDQQITE